MAISLLKYIWSPGQKGLYFVSGVTGGTTRSPPVSRAAFISSSRCEAWECVVRLSGTATAKQTAKRASATAENPVKRCFLPLANRPDSRRRLAMVV